MYDRGGVGFPGEGLRSESAPKALSEAAEKPRATFGPGRLGGAPLLQFRGATAERSADHMAHVQTVSECIGDSETQEACNIHRRDASIRPVAEMSLFALSL